MASENGELPPGRFESPLEEWSGYIQFPAPLMWQHVKVWWQTAIEPLEKRKLIKLEYHECEWEAAKRLLLDYGEWAIDGIPPGDVSDDNLPGEVLAWVTDKAGEYVYPKLPRNMQRVARGVR